MDGGKRVITIDEVPLEWCMGQGVKLDFRQFEDGYVASAEDVAAELERIGHEVQPLDIVVVNTRAGEVHGGDGYVDAGCGMGREATLYLLERGVRVTGTDAWSWGRTLRPHRQALGRRTTTRASSGKATGLGARSAIATSKSCTIWSNCPRPASRSSAYRLKSRPHPPAGPVR